MDIHKPKAAHSWREFAVEIGTIICGILIALGLEQLVETLHWRHQVAEARNSLSLELATLVGAAEWRTKQSTCIERRLDEFAVLVDNAEKSGRLPPVGEPGQPAFFNWSSGVWQSAMSAQTAAHLTPAELKGYSNAYRFIELVAEANRDEGRVWTTLFGLVGPGHPFNADAAEKYRQAIQEARYLDRYIGGMGVRAHQSLDAYHIGFDRPLYDRITARPLQNLPICKPVETTAPLHYGAAPLGDFVARARAQPLTADVQREERR